MQIRTTLLAAIAVLPLLATGASAHGWWGGDGYGRSEGHDWREREARREWVQPRRERDWAWQQHQAREQRARFEAARQYQGSWGPRW
jgi:hypothetical protein